MKTTLSILTILLATCLCARAQVVPAATAPGSVPLIPSGTLHYDLRYSQSSEIGDGQNGRQWSFLSGDAGYNNTSARLPFSMQYGGGYGWEWAGPPSAGNVFQHLALSQGISSRFWNFLASDSVSYSFETPTVGFSGVPGTGEPIGGTGSTTSTDQTILSLNARILDNIANASIGRSLTRATSLNFSGSSGRLYYIDGNGLDTNTLSASTGVTHRLNGHSSVSGQYSFTDFTYEGTSLASHIDTLQGTYSRQLGRHVNLSGSFGPQWISSTNSALVPNSTRSSGSASITEVFKFGSGSLNYSHGAQGGSGYMYGSEVDSLYANFSRALGRHWNAGLTSAYMRSTGLSGGFATNSAYGSAQASRKLGRYFNIFFNYSAAEQSTNLPASTNALNSLSQSVSFGIGYSPRGTRLRP